MTRKASHPIGLLGASDPLPPSEPLPPVKTIPLPVFFDYAGHLLRHPEAAEALLTKGSPDLVANGEKRRGDPADHSLAAHLIARDLRLPGIPLLDRLADMLDPTKETEWRLEFKRERDAGRPRKPLLPEFEHYRAHYEAHGVSGPSNRAVELIAERHGRDPESIKRELTRERKDRRATKSS